MRRPQEYKDGLQGGPGCAYGGKHGDMAYAAAFILHTVPQLTGLDAFSWWTISDVFEEGWLSGLPFYGVRACPVFLSVSCGTNQAVNPAGASLLLLLVHFAPPSSLTLRWACCRATAC